MIVLRHIVMWKFLDEAEGLTKQQNMSLVAGQLLALEGVVPELFGIEVGMDVQHSPESYDMAIIGTFRDTNGMLAYRSHPEHVKISQYMKLVTYERVTADIYVDDTVYFEMPTDEVLIN